MLQCQRAGPASEKPLAQKHKLQWFTLLQLHNDPLTRLVQLLKEHLQLVQL